MNYPDLREGDQLPMVGVLQHLLNRTGASLAPDGVLGKQTLAAVKTFQAPRGLLPDGVVGEKTWSRLIAGVSLPIVDAVDITDPTFLKEDATYIRKTSDNPLLIGGMCNGVEQTVSLLSGWKNIFLLRFHGHGAPGVAGVASGQESGMKERSDIWADPLMIGILSRLRPIFGPYGCVQFIECETGRGPQGRRLLTQLARALNVPITAAVLDQPFGRRWSFRLYGPTITIVPGGGSLRDWCRFLPPFAGMSVA